MKKITFLLTCLIAIGLSTSVYAVNWIAILKDTPAEKFNEDDMILFLDTARKALNELPEGQSLSWENPETKAHGTITVEISGTRSGQTCKRLGIENVAGNRQAKSALDLCMGKDGKWELMAPR
jgi:surface antigen